jgi:hypothetical protein
VFLGQIHVDISNSLNSASQSLDAWKSVTDPDVLRGLQVKAKAPFFVTLLFAEKKERKLHKLHLLKDFFPWLS